MKMYKWITLLLITIIITVGCASSGVEQNKDIGGDYMFQTQLEIKGESEQMQFQLSLVNTSDEEVTLEFPSGQQFEITITNEAGDVVYRYSDEKMFIMALTYETLKPSETITWEDEWDQTIEGELAPPGTYDVVAEILVSSVDGEPIEPSTFKAEKSFTIE